VFSALLYIIAVIKA